MRDKIRIHVSELFSEAPANPRTQDLKEELIANLQERYDDLLAQGSSEESAYRTVVDSIGDVGDLVSAMREQNVFDTAWERQQRQKSALLTSTAVGLYIISPIFVIVFSAYYNLHVLGLALLLLCCALATGLLVYNYTSRPKYTKSSDTLVDDFREWKQEKGKSKALRNAIFSLVWSVAVVIFFILGFFTGTWATAWLVFLVAVAVNQVIRLIFTYREDLDR